MSRTVKYKVSDPVAETHRNLNLSLKGAQKKRAEGYILEKKTETTFVFDPKRVHTLAQLEKYRSLYTVIGYSLKKEELEKEALKDAALEERLEAIYKQTLVELDIDNPDGIIQRLKFL